MNIIERLRSKTERTLAALKLSDILPIIGDSISDWYKVTIETLKDYIEGAGYMPDTILLPYGNIKIERDQSDTNTADGINIKVYNTYAAYIQWRVSGTLFTLSSPQNLTLSAPDATYNRIDLVYLDNVGGCSVITGTPASIPIEPVLPNGIRLAFIYVRTTGDVTVNLPPASVDIFQETFEYYVKDVDIDVSSFDISLPSDVREYFHVFCFVNGDLLLTHQYNYSAGSNIVTINNSQIRYKLIAGWPIKLFWTKRQSTQVQTNNVSLLGITHDFPQDYNDIEFDLQFDNTGTEAQDINLILRLFNSSNVQIDTDQNVVYSVLAGGSTYTTSIFQNLPNDTYTLQCSGDFVGSDSVEITTPAQSNTYVFSAGRNSNTSVISQCVVENENGVSGQVTLQFDIDGGTKYPVTLYVPANTVVTFTYIFYGVDANAHTCKLYDDQDNEIDSAAITSLSQEIVAGTSMGDRRVTWQELNGQLWDYPYWQGGRNGYAPGVYKWDYGIYRILFKYLLRIIIPIDLSGITDIKIKLVFDKTPDTIYLDNLGIFLHNSNIKTCSVTDAYNNIDTVDQVDSYSQYINSVTFTLKSSVFSSFETNANGYIDLAILPKSDDYANSYLNGSIIGIYGAQSQAVITE